MSPGDARAALAVSALTYGDVCREFVESGECASARFMNGVHLAPRWRFAPAFSLGALGSASWVMTTSSETHRYLSAEAEGRWRPDAGAGSDRWLGVDAGVVTVVDHFDARGSQLDETYSRAAPMFGIGAGMDFPVASLVAVGQCCCSVAKLSSLNARSGILSGPVAFRA